MAPVFRRSALSSVTASSSASPSLTLLLLLLLLCWLPPMSAYFVLTRYSALPRSDPLASREWPSSSSSAESSAGVAAAAASSSLDQMARELGVEEWMRPLLSWDDAEDRSQQQQQFASGKGKRSAGAAKTLSGHEHVCATIIRPDFRPAVGHEQNGTRVEIQQDERRQFSATFVECENTKREHCHGIDNAMFSSECVTVYEFRTAGVRLEGSSDDFVEGLVKVPITCQCRLRRKIGNGLLTNL